MRYFLIVLTAIFLSAALFDVAAADTASSTNFRIERAVISVGGGRATSSGFFLEQSVGQIGTGISTSTSFLLRGGFLHFLQPAAPAAQPTEEEPGPEPSSGPGGGAAGTGFYPPTTTIPGLEILPPGEAPPLAEAPPPERVDCNADGKIDMVDLSIILFYFEQSPPFPACTDLNLNGRVDFPDVSILMFYWGGA